MERIIQKKRIRMFLILFFLIAELFSISSRALAISAGPSLATATLEVTYEQTTARQMLSLINDFRTGDDAYYLASDNTTIVRVPGLSTLTYSKALEEIAMQRAAEIAMLWGHTRPNGSRCNTCLSSNGTSSNGENIIFGCGFSIPYDEAFLLWREDDDDYSGQGHRRNMLGGNYTSVGIGHTQVGNCVFWVQEFGTANDSAGTAYNGTKSVDVEISNTMIDSIESVVGNPNQITINKGKSANLPKAEVTLEMTFTRTVPVSTTWTSDDTSIAYVSNGKVIGAAAGKTKLRTTLYGKTTTVSVTVEGGPKMTGMSIITPKGEVANGTTQKANVGKSYTFTIMPKPSNASNAVTWKSSNTSIATVTSAGKVTVKAVGSVKITATAKDGSGVKASFTLKCDPPKATEIFIYNENNSLLNNRNFSTNKAVYQLRTNVRPSTALQSFGYVSSDTTVALVHPTEGKITFLKPGTTTITVNTRDASGVKGSFTITYKPIKTTKLSLYGPDNTIVSGKSVTTKTRIYKLDAVARPTEALQFFSWISSDKSIATVNFYGTVGFHKPGTVKIQAGARDASGHRATVTITYAP